MRGGGGGGGGDSTFQRRSSACSQRPPMPGQRHLDREHDADLDSDNGQEVIAVILIRKRVAHPPLRLEAGLRHENRAPDAGGYGFALLQHVGAAADVLPQYDAALRGLVVGAYTRPLFSSI